MNPITYIEAGDVTGALYHSQDQDRAFIAGGTNLIDLMKEQVARPRTLVDINGLALADIVPGQDGGLLLGA
ncbi:MAG TPA: FAD binding domain-containing protein, partial [Duganella sp.]|nr:FAD binding domain-containing protein [Duganella sp.]